MEVHFIEGKEKVCFRAFFFLWKNKGQTIMDTESDEKL